MQLPSGHVASVPKANPQFKAWPDEVPFNRYGNKAVLDFQGKPLFAELVILRLFEEIGWSGVWVDTYRRRFRTGVDECTEIPAEKLRLLEKIYATAGASSGCFDVFVWREEEIVFAESKRAGRDRIRPSQSRWLDATLRSDIALSSLLVVEWTLNNEPSPPPYTRG